MLKKYFSSQDNPVLRRVLLHILVALLALFVLLLIHTTAPDSLLRLYPLLYLLCAAAADILYVLVCRRISPINDNHPLLGNMTLDLMSRLRQPVLICDDRGKVVWYNNSLVAKMNVNSLYGQTISDFSALTPEDILSSNAAEGVEARIWDIPFAIRGYRFAIQNREYILTIWTDKSELNRLYRQLADETAVLAYIMVDNLDDLQQNMKEQYRAVSGEAESILREWANSVNGVLKEYERDHYLFLFRAADLEQFIANRFEILDRVREIRAGESTMAITLSIGISGSIGSLNEKEHAASAALDMALQRGGDQVVIKNENGLEFYGGRNKSVQKRTKVRARVVANELLMLISKSSNVLIMGHRNADFDALGACAGLARIAKFCGVKANIIVQYDDPNLQKCFQKLSAVPDYNDVFVSAIDAQDMINSETLLLIADVNNPAQFESPGIAENAFTTAIIDHHRKAAEFENKPALAYIEPSASSTCELIAEILEQVIPSGQLPKAEADLLYAGILLDTQQFSRNTGARTFTAALYLRGEGANPTDVQELFKTDLNDFIREANFTTNVYMYRNSIAFAVNDREDNTALDRIAAAKAADKLLSVEGVQASFALCRIDEVIHISARSSGKINVQLILESLNGGGHFDAAGAQIAGGDMAEALRLLRDAVDNYLEQL